MAVQFRLVLNVLQCIANYWEKKNPTLIKQPAGARDAFTLLRAFLRAGGSSAGLALESSWQHHGTSPSRRERLPQGPAQPRERGLILLPSRRSHRIFPLSHPRELCFPDTAPLFCPRREAWAELLFTHVNTRRQLAPAAQ